MRIGYIATTFVLVCSTSILFGCGQAGVKAFGGTMTLDEFPPCKKLVNVTWKDTSIWYLYRDMKPGEEPETYHFKESSQFGNLEGEVIISETKPATCPNRD